jgi:hypothetical protein
MLFAEVNFDEFRREYVIAGTPVRQVGPAEVDLARALPPGKEPSE